MVFFVKPPSFLSMRHCLSSEHEGWRVVCSVPFRLCSGLSLRWSKTVSIPFSGELVMENSTSRWICPRSPLIFLPELGGFVYWTSLCWTWIGKRRPRTILHQFRAGRRVSRIRFCRLDSEGHVFSVACLQSECVVHNWFIVSAAKYQLPRLGRCFDGGSAVAS